jgi:hypothetical protein
VRSSGLSSELQKLGALGMGGGARAGGAGLSSNGGWSNVGSDGEYECLLLPNSLSDARRPGLEQAVGRHDDDDDGDCDVYSGLCSGVGGHSGFVGSSMGVEILGRLSMEEPRDDRDEGPLPLMDSVSLPHENDREVRVACCGVFSVGEFGGV